MGVDPARGLTNPFSEVVFRMAGLGREEEGGCGLRDSQGVVGRQHEMAGQELKEHLWTKRMEQRGRVSGQELGCGQRASRDTVDSFIHLLLSPCIH